MKTEMSEKELRELDAWIANYFEPKPEVVPLRRVDGSRDSEYNYAEAVSPGGWWRCATGSDAEDERGRNTPCAWVPRYNIASDSEESESQAAAMQVLEKCAEKTSVHVNKGETGWFVSDLNNKSRWEIADTLPLALAKFSKELFK